MHMRTPHFAVICLIVTGFASLVGQNSFANAQEARAAGSDASVQLSPACRSVTLDGTWQLSYGPVKSLDTLKEDLTQPPSDYSTIPATVPGDTGLDLMAAGKVKDPTVGKNVFELLKYETYQWWYKRTFPTPQLNAGEKAELVFDGLDCLGTVWVNGKLAGRAADMFIAHRFDVTSLLHPAGEQNEVLVRIDPALLAGRVQCYPGEWHLFGHWNHLTIRKSGFQYGWDVAPRIIGAGLWQSVRLEMTKPTHLRSVYWTTKVISLEKKQASEIVDWDFETDRIDIYPMKIRVELSRNGKVVLQKEFRTLDTHGQQCMDGISNVDFWWPRGFGEPALYDARVSLLDENGNLLDERKDRIGIRKIQLMHTDITMPQSPGYFYFLVNGQKLFIRGGNWGFLDSFPSREAKRLDKMFPLIVDMNLNLIRLNGQGLYGSDRLYQLCDENGVLVWQDFTLGNERAQQTDAFRATMAEEAGAAITRIRNHPSLAIYCGGNEADYDYYVRDGLDPNTIDTITRAVFPQAIQRYDFGRTNGGYIFSTPDIGPALIPIGTKALPDVHLYSSAYFKAPFFTSDVAASFVSETGRGGIPSRASLVQMMDPGCVDPWVKNHELNDEWAVKFSQNFPWDNYNGKISDVIADIKNTFTDVPENLDDLIVASQAAQGEALKFWVDLWRIRKGDRWGINIWSFHDGWPLISYGMVDYYNRKKLSYEYVQDSMRDVQAICGEVENGVHPVVIVNDTLQPVRGTVKVERVGEAAAPLLDTKFEVGANGKIKVGAIPKPKGSEMWQLEWKLENGLEFKTHYLATESKVSLKEYEGWMKQLGISIP